MRGRTICQIVVACCLALCHAKPQPDPEPEPDVNVNVNIDVNQPKGQKDNDINVDVNLNIDKPTECTATGGKWLPENQCNTEYTCEGEKVCCLGDKPPECTANGGECLPEKQCNGTHYTEYSCNGENVCCFGGSPIFTCSNGRVIPESWRCDGFDECGDNSDEESCGTCVEGAILCNNGTIDCCIRESWQCDGFEDCHDGSDEANCEFQSDTKASKTLDCRAGEFPCRNGRHCIRPSWKCDGWNDCGDNSDEDTSMCRNKCSSTAFMCKTNGKCIPGYKKCNKKVDCDDKSDEEDCICEICGYANTGRIVGGSEVSPMRKYPWQVALKKPDFYGYKIICGGSIINDRWILTAAHCAVESKTCRFRFDIKVWVGEHEHKETSDDTSDTKEYTLESIIIHYKYDCKIKYSTYDFALLELKDAIPFNSVIRPVCLPKYDSKTYVGKTATISGWGRTSYNGKVSYHLKELQVSILANSRCGEFGTAESVELCAGGKEGESPCNGDSGGPLVVIENNRYVLVGVASAVHKNSRCTRDNYPAKYARVSKVLHWISISAMGDKRCGQIKQLF